MYDVEEKRILFAKTYSASLLLFYFFSGIILVTVNFNVDYGILITQIGQTLSGINFISLHSLVLLASIIIGKKVNAYRGALSFPSAEQVFIDWKSLQKAPFARRIGVRLRYWTQRLTPFKAVGNYILWLATSWLLAAYVVICFGAPLLSHQGKTAAFVTHLWLQSVVPIILIEGPKIERLLTIIQGQESEDALGLLLKRNAFGAIGGAWLGAFPIPLDWDRPWQSWPLTCILGTFAASLLTHTWSLIEICRASSKRKKPTLISTNKKQT